jgi:hypothetical protein
MRVALPALAAFVLASAVALVVGCSSKSKTPPPSPVPTGATIDQACNETATAFCMKQDGCSPTTRQVDFADLPTCISRIKASCVTNATAPGASVTVQQLTACTNAYHEQSCADALTSKTPDACNFPGQLANGSACATDAQCMGARCSKAVGDTCGKCAARGDSEATCIANEDCVGALFCVNGKCVMPSGQGESCDPTAPCGTGLACTNKQCAPVLAQGTTCKIEDQNCDLLAGGVTCGPASLTCDPIAFVDGGACGFASRTSPDAFCIAGKCLFDPMGMGMGTCVANAADGQPCGGPGTNGPNCTIPAICHQGTCSLPDPSACK